MKFKFAGNKVLIAGGSSQIGITLARQLMDQGLVPVLTFRDEKGKSRIKNELGDLKGAFETAFLDFGAPTSISALFAGTNEDPDYLVDLAHTEYESLVASASCDTAHTYFEENISARSDLLRAASRSMLRRKFGRLIFISSAAVARPVEGQGFYAASKLASEALYKNCGLELCSKGVTSLILRPGYVDAGRGIKFLENNSYYQMKNINEYKTSVRKKGPVIVSVSDLCSAIVFFLSDSANAFNATEITMDHGLSAGK